MKLPKLTNSKDGKLRITMKVETRLSTEDLATFWLAYNSADVSCIDGVWDKDSLILLLEKQGPKAFMNAVKDSILAYGVEVPGYKVSDENIPEELREAVRNYIEKWLTH